MSHDGQKRPDQDKYQAVVFFKVEQSKSLNLRVSSYQAKCAKARLASAILCVSSFFLTAFPSSLAARISS